MKNLLTSAFFVVLSLSEAQEMVVDHSGGVGISIATETATYYILKRSEDLVSLSTSSDSIAFEGNGTQIEPLLTSSLPKTFFQVISEPLKAISSQSAATFFEGKTVLGVNFLSGNRWSWFGVTGTWTYQVNSAQVASIVLDWDNDEFSEDTITLDFGTDGALATVNYAWSFENDQGNGLQTKSGTVDLNQNSFAPIDLVFTDLLEGQTYLDYNFTSSSRFLWNGNEPGNYTWQRLSDDEIKIIFTYDEDGNDASVYREEVTLTFNGTNRVPVFYELYEFGSLEASQSAGIITLSVAD